MCGRFGMLHTWTDMFESYRLISTPLNVAPRFNIAPTQPVLAVIPSQVRKGNVATHFQWGLVPPWAKEVAIGSKMINARAETVAEKPAFRQAFRRRRCLIPASGFYEWQKPTGEKGPNGPKQPFWISAADGGLLTFAGLWESLMSADGSELETCTIITTTANDALAPIHARMPVIVAPADFQTWLDVSDETATAAASALLRPAADSVTTARPVSTRVNSVRNDDASLIEPGEASSEGGATFAAPAKNQGDLFS
ncbi:MAG: SOS response-associated peptidase [Alphaproteobacteria bacterium]|nr:SOS response-associated peptidase [Alphaproteobacteria bacterium]